MCPTIQFDGETREAKLAVGVARIYYLITRCVSTQQQARDKIGWE